MANRKKEANEQKLQISKTTSTTLSNKKRAIYIVLHVSTIQIGELIGKASAPVKVKQINIILFHYLGSWLWCFLVKVHCKYLESALHMFKSFWLWIIKLVLTDLNNSIFSQMFCVKTYATAWILISFYLKMHNIILTIKGQFEPCIWHCSYPLTHCLSSSIVSVDQNLSSRASLKTL